MKRYNFASSTSPCVIPLLLRGPWKFLHLWLVLTLGLLCTGLLQFRRHSGQSPTKWLSLETSGVQLHWPQGILQHIGSLVDKMLKDPTGW